MSSYITCIWNTLTLTISKRVPGTLKVLNECICNELMNDFYAKLVNSEILGLSFILHLGNIHQGCTENSHSFKNEKRKKS